jgi:hypothetical protein
MLQGILLEGTVSPPPRRYWNSCKHCSYSIQWLWAWWNVTFSIVGSAQRERTSFNTRAIDDTSRCRFMDAIIVYDAIP